MILDGADPAVIQRAAQLLAHGDLVGFPTETVYGLGADALNDAAVAGIFAAKGRPSEHPLIVHVADSTSAGRFAASVPVFAQHMMRQLWPGPLTLVLERRDDVARAAAGGQDSIALRCPSHPVAQALLLACRDLPGHAMHGIAGPSANRFGRVSPTTALHVQSELGDALPILDGGPCTVGIESSIVDCTRGAPVLLRPGVLTRARIEAAAGCALAAPELLHGDAPRASGTLEAHYAPMARVRLMDARALQTALNVLGTDAANIAVYSRTPVHIRSARVVLRRMPDDPQATAQQLFAVLRDFDAQGVRLIWVETPPATAEWEGVRDRLQRASAV
jgi:L-threonylcarbamoyladenylate synthase